MPSIHAKLKKAGVKCSGWQSDLYAERNDISKEIIDEYEFKNNVTSFLGNDGITYYDIPFANDDFWEKRGKVKLKRAIVGKNHGRLGARLISISESLDMVKTVAELLQVDQNLAITEFKNAGYNVFNKKWKNFLKKVQAR